LSWPVTSPTVPPGSVTSSWHIRFYWQESGQSRDFTDAAKTAPTTARDSLIWGGVELLGEPGPAWQHVGEPDGNVCELVTS
jgi:hypothetical protein